MRKSSRVLALLLVCAASQAATTGDGLQVKTASLSWPSWQARLVVSLPSVSPLGTSTFGGATTLAGDRYFDWARLGDTGGFRATGALMFNTSILANSAQNNGSNPFALATSVRMPSLRANDGGESGAMPYLGMGYSAAWPKQGLGLSADLGLLAQRPGNGRIGRLLSGTDGVDDYARALQIAPVLQVQLSYAF